MENKKLLIVVDMQKDFIDGALGTMQAKNIVEDVVEKIKQYQSRGDEIIFTLDTHGENYLQTQEGHKLAIEHCIKGTKGHALCKELQHIEGIERYKIFEKHTFGSKELAMELGDKGYTHIELIGVCTDICVISNAMLIKAFVPEVAITVDATCCAGVTPESHKIALNAMEMCQISITNK